MSPRYNTWWGGRRPTNGRGGLRPSVAIAGHRRRRHLPVATDGTAVSCTLFANNIIVLVLGRLSAKHVFVRRTYSARITHDANDNNNNNNNINNIDDDENNRIAAVCNRWTGGESYRNRRYRCTMRRIRPPPLEEKVFVVFSGVLGSAGSSAPTTAPPSLVAIRWTPAILFRVDFYWFSTAISSYLVALVYFIMR